MKALLKFLGIMAGILLLSAFLAPILHDFLPYKFERIFNRCIMVFTLAAIFVFVRFTPQTLQKYGLVWGPESKKHLAAGFFAGIITLAVLAAVKFSVGLAAWKLADISAGRWIYKFVVILGTGFLVGTIEEFFFRGFIFKFFRERLSMNLVLAIVVTSVFYSLIHFVGEKKPFIGPDPGFKDGLKLALAPFMSLVEWREYWRDAVGLFFFGIILNQMVIRTGALFLSIGLHAGCVFFVKSDGLFVDFFNNHPILWGSAKMYDSVMGWVFLALMGFLLGIYTDKVLKKNTALPV